jgi:peptidoglycan/LPS O-acetylase OafA/YrhL
MAARPFNAVGRESFATRAASRCNGFDAFRLILAAGITAFHSFTITHGSVAGMPEAVQALARLILPAFFTLSGYLVAGSLSRCASLQEFLLLRLLRLLPALSVVVAATALILGPLLTNLEWQDYFGDPLLPAYFRNIWAEPRFDLPGLFSGNPRPGVANGSLWTIQLEAACYAMLAGIALLRSWTTELLVAGIAVFLLNPWGLSCPELFVSFALGALLFRGARYVPHHSLPAVISLAAAFWLALDVTRMSLVPLPLSYGVLWLALRRIPFIRADYSYGVYLTAYPLEQSVVAMLPGIAWWMELALAFPLALAGAALLWHGVEKPLLSRKHEFIARLSRKPVRIAA